MSRYEFRWALFHPFAAVKVKDIAKKCDHYLEESRHSKIKPLHKANLDRYSYGGKLDAFRHIFYMSAFAQKINVNKLRKLGIAHEKNNYRTFKQGRDEFGELPDSIGTVMDIFNNEIGFKIGAGNKTVDFEQLEDLVMDAIKKGEAQVMKRNEKGEYLDCDGKVINLQDYKGKWGVPKCLVSSANTK